MAKKVEEEVVQEEIDDIDIEDDLDIIEENTTDLEKIFSVSLKIYKEHDSKIDYIKLKEDLESGAGSSELLKEDVEKIRKIYGQFDNIEKLSNKLALILLYTERIGEPLDDYFKEEKVEEKPIKPVKKTVNNKPSQKKTNIKTNTGNTVKKSKSNVCSFKINLSNFDKMLEILSCGGFDESTRKKKVDIINDCILRFDKENSKIYAIVSDKKKSLICQVKCKIYDLEKPQDIPIEITDIRELLSSYNFDDIEFVYENGIIAMKDVYSNDMNIEMKLDGIIATKRLEAIKNDFILEFSNVNKDVANEIISNSTIWNENKTGITIKLNKNINMWNSFDISIDVFKKVIDDGNKIDYRVYPFEFNNDNLVISIRNPKESSTNQLIRTIFPKNYNISKEFKSVFSSRLSNAIYNLNNIVKCYISDGTPLCLLSVNKDFEIFYIVTTF